MDGGCSRQIFDHLLSGTYRQIERGNGRTLLSEPATDCCTDARPATGDGRDLSLKAHWSARQTNVVEATWRVTFVGGGHALS